MESTSNPSTWEKKRKSIRSSCWNKDQWCLSAFQFTVGMERWNTLRAFQCKSYIISYTATAWSPIIWMHFIWITTHFNTNALISQCFFLLSSCKKTVWDYSFFFFFYILLPLDAHAMHIFQINKLVSLRNLTHTEMSHHMRSQWLTRVLKSNPKVLLFLWKFSICYVKTPA